MKFTNFIIVVSLLGVACCLFSNPYELSAAQKKAIGMQIWKNEASQKYDLLIFWNEHESFPSLGICHFIWVPANQEPTVTQKFPDLLDYLQHRGVKLPVWLLEARQTGAPWQNRADFLKHKHDARIQELKKLLFDTIDLQVEFVIERLQQGWQGICQHAIPWKRRRISEYFTIMSKTPQGMYALIDYLNFKGEGTNPLEGYQGKGWGLLQVFEAMPANIPPMAVVAAFARAAKSVLEERVARAPASKAHEKKWLPGWKNRIDTYLMFNPSYC